MDNALTATPTNRPYAPPSNVIAILTRLRERNPPSRIDNEYLRDISIPEGTISRVLFALKFLGLIEDDSSPSATMRSIATSTDEEYRETLSRTLRSAYSDVFKRADPTQEPQDRVLNVFRRFTPASQRERMVIFFLGMCREAGMQVVDAPRQRSSAAGPRLPANRQLTKASTAIKKTAGRPVNIQRSVETQDTTGIPAALSLLVRSLPPEGAVLTMERRDQWLKMAEATLAFIYLDQEPAVDEDEGFDDQDAF